jgi:phosphate starvation-inducible protein PhoH and related proteins
MAAADPTCRSGIAGKPSLPSRFLLHTRFFEPSAISLAVFSCSPDRSSLMGKRSIAKRTKAIDGAGRHPWLDEPSAARGPRLKSIEGGRGWHPEDAAPGDRTQRYQKTVAARTPGQQALMDAMDTHALVCALGPAGTGKTYLAICKAVEALQKGTVARIVLARPAVEAGEQIGFLPGAMEDKLAPYLRPLYDALSDRMSPGQLKHMLAEGVIEIAPIGFMRGRTLSNAFIVVDEAQNCTYPQLKMLLTRLGWHSTMVITGDPLQTDLPGTTSGLATAADRLTAISGAAIVRLTGADVVRHPLVQEMLGVL